MAWQDFENIAGQILAIDPNSLPRSSELGTQSAFVGIDTLFANVQVMISSISKPGIDVIPEDLYQSSFGFMQQFIQVVGQIRDFNQNVPNATAIRQTIYNQVRAAYNSLMPLLALMTVITGSFRETNTEERIKEMLNRYDAAISGIESQITKKLSEIDSDLKLSSADNLAKIQGDAKAVQEILDHTRQQVAEVVSGKASERFGAASNRFERAAKWWLVGTLLGVSSLLVCAGYALYLSLNGIYSGKTNPEIAQIAISKIIFLGILGYLTNFCAKSYFANEHNKTINSHRSNALASYQAITDATNSADKKDIILTQAAIAIFSNQDTAFVKQSSSSDLPSTIINAVSKPVLGGQAEH